MPGCSSSQSSNGNRRGIGSGTMPAPTMSSGAAGAVNAVCRSCSRTPESGVHPCKAFKAPARPTMASRRSRSDSLDHTRSRRSPEIRCRTSHVKPSVDPAATTLACGTDAGSDSRSIASRSRRFRSPRQHTRSTAPPASHVSFDQLSARTASPRSIGTAGRTISKRAAGSFTRPPYVIRTTWESHGPEATRPAPTYSHRPSNDQASAPGGG